VQARLVVTGQHRHGALGEHRSGVHPGVDEVDRRAGGVHPGGQGVAHGVRAREGGQQRRVGVDHPAGEGVQDSGAEQLHEPRADDPVRTARGELGRQRPVPGGPVGVGAQRGDERRHPPGAGVQQPGGVGAVGADGDHLERLVRLRRGGQQRRAEAAGAGQQDDDPGPGGAGPRDGGCVGGHGRPP
jgi:hypothetical protein